MPMLQRSTLLLRVCPVLLALLLCVLAGLAPARVFGQARLPNLHDGGRGIGPPIRLERRVGQVGAALPDSWRQGAPRDLLAYATASLRAPLATPGEAEPLTPITVTLSVPGYSGPAELRIYDGAGRPAGVWQALVQGGAASLVVEGRGALGPHQAIVLIDGRIAGTNSRLFTLIATTAIETGQPSIDDLYPRLRGFLEQDAVEYALDGYRIRGY